MESSLDLVKGVESVNNLIAKIETLHMVVKLWDVKKIKGYKSCTSP